MNTMKEFLLPCPSLNRRWKEPMWGFIQGATEVSRGCLLAGVQWHRVGPLHQPLLQPLDEVPRLEGRPELGPLSRDHWMRRMDRGLEPQQAPVGRGQVLLPVS